MKPIAVTIEEASRLLSLGRTKIYKELAAGRLQGKKIGKRTIILRESIEAYATGLQDYAGTEKSNPSCSKN